jgi:hypothetical protein
MPKVGSDDYWASRSTKGGPSNISRSGMGESERGLGLPEGNMLAAEESERGLGLPEGNMLAEEADPNGALGYGTLANPSPHGKVGSDDYFASKSFGGGPSKISRSGMGEAPEGGRTQNPDQLPSGGGGEQFVHKPHAFALTHGDGGAKIAYGELHYGVTIQEVKRVDLAEGKTVVESITQNPIQETKVCVPEWDGEELDPKIPNEFTQLDGYGEIFLYWEYELGSGGEVTVCEVKVGRPEELDISFLNEELKRSGGGGSGGGCTGKFALLLGIVNEGEPVQQKATSDIPWFAHIIQDSGSCGSDSSSSSDSSDSSSDDSDSGTSTGGSSSKSTCIVHVPRWFHTSGYAALFIMESPEVRFEDFTKVEITGRITRVPVDPKYVVVCEPGTLNVRSVQGKRPASYGAWIGYDGYLYIDSGRLWRLKRGEVNVSITGIRRGFAHSSNPSDPFYNTRFPARTIEQFYDNEKFINQAYSHQKENV